MSVISIWSLLFQFYYFKLIWIFIFIVLVITTFLLVSFGKERDELNKRIFPDEYKDENLNVIKIETDNNLEKQLLNFNDHLEENKNLLKQTRHKIDETEEVVQKVEDQSKKIHSQHKSFILEMKQEILNTEKEIKKLQFDISNLVERRKKINESVTKHQHICEKIVQNCQRKLDNSSVI